MQFIRRIILALRDIFGGAMPLLATWVMVLLAMPIAQWAGGHPALIAGVILGVLLQASLAVLFLAQAASFRRTMLTVLIVVVIAWASETLGSKTGFPFGAYDYTAILQPQLLGVPLLIPLAWLMMLPPAWAVAQRITGRTSGPFFVLVSAAAFTAWDLFLDPQMVRWGLWVWEERGAYFGIPPINFAGWLLIAGLITALARPVALPQKPLIAIYALTWLIETVGQIVFWQLYGSAAFGFVGMGVFVWLAWQREGGGEGR